MQYVYCAGIKHAVYLLHWGELTMCLLRWGKTKSTLLLHFPARWLALAVATFLMCASHRLETAAEQQN